MQYFSVLVVDDEKDFVETLVNRLKKRDVDAVGVRSGEEALELIKSKEFDVVIMDIKMPGGMDGIEAMRHVKKERPLTEVILLTGHASVETSIEGMKFGAFDYVLKPAKLEDLLKKIALALERKNEHDQKNRNQQIKKLLKYW
ncbi:MAG: response regulator [Desulfobacterales bacterium]